MKGVNLILLFFFICPFFSSPIVICNETALSYLSGFALSKQNDLNKTFTVLTSQISVPSFNYTPRIGKTYIIEDMKVNFFVINSKEISQITQLNRQKISGSVLKLSYNFTWEKKQLGSSLRGTAQGVVLSDPLNFTKQIRMMTGEPEEFLFSNEDITFTNSFPVSKVNPYSQNDSDTLFIMMNTAVTHESGKDIISKALNQNFSKVLNDTIFADSSELSVPKTITYSYFDYRGEYKIQYDNGAINFMLEQDGMILLLRQVITDDPNFECGPQMPTFPEDKKIYGGKQNIISNSVLKSTVRYILNKGYFDVVLNQQNWESRAFQFYAGDLYLAIPSLKKAATAQTPIEGTCKAFDDAAFNFSVKSDTQYLVNLNFTCSLSIINTLIAKFNIVTANIINVTLNTKDLTFKIHTITGTPSFADVDGYKIENLDFAQFLISETLKVAQGSNVFGTGYKTNQRQHPNAKVRKDYLLMYDPSYIAKKQ